MINESGNPQEWIIHCPVLDCTGSNRRRLKKRAVESISRSFFMRGGKKGVDPPTPYPPFYPLYYPQESYIY